MSNPNHQPAGSPEGGQFAPGEGGGGSSPQAFVDNHLAGQQRSTNLKQFDKHMADVQAAIDGLRRSEPPPPIPKAPGAFSRAVDAATSAAPFAALAAWVSR